MTRQRLVLGAGITSLVVAAATLIPSMSFAQTAEETPTEVAAEAHCELGFSGFGTGGLRFGEVRGERGEDLAEALGITVEELQAATTTARESAVDLLGDDADRDAIRDARRVALAAELGITVEALEAAERAVQDAKAAEMIARIEAKVADGTLTREQADHAIAAIESGERFHGGLTGLRGGPFRGPRA